MKKTIFNEHYTEDEDTLELVRNGVIVRDNDVNEDIEQEVGSGHIDGGRRIVKIPLTVE